MRSKGEKKMNMLRRFVRDESGTETVEWAIMIGLIAVASIMIIWAIGQWVQTRFSTLNSALANSTAS
jgi:Flp pilus assembly pilin Flp